MKPDGSNCAGRAAPNSVIGWISLATAALSLVLAYLVYRWSFFLASIDLGDNDFAGLVCLLFEVALVVLALGVSVTSAVLGLVSTFRGGNRWLGPTAVALALISVALTSVCFLGLVVFPD